MQMLTLIVGVASILPCNALTRQGPSGALSFANSTCKLATRVSESTSLDLSEDNPLLSPDSPLAAWGASVQSNSGNAKAEFANAIQEYKMQKAKFQSAESRLMGAMEKLLEVPRVDGADLTKLLDGKRQDTLVVFYAPWCPHCQTFVLHDKRGDPTNAPLENLYRKIQESPKTKHASVVRFDVERNGKDMPPAFQLEGIPTVFFVGGPKMQATKYDGDPHDESSLFNFVATMSK